jgi:hypothetical protein
MNELQFSKVKNVEGFIAALDQSGGSTPKALKLYGIEDGAYSGDEEMFDLVHAMRSRIITSPSFSGDRILGSILFEMTMDRQIEGRGSADYLWNVKNVVPFLKVDKGLADEVDGAQVMKPMPGLDALLARAVEKGVFGTKMRSVIRLGNGTGVQAVVDQQFEVGRQILAGGLVPILEPEIDIHSPSEASPLTAEAQLTLGAEVCGRGQHKYAAPCAGSRFTRLAPSLCCPDRPHCAEIPTHQSQAGRPTRHGCLMHQGLEQDVVQNPGCTNAATTSTKTQDQRPSLEHKGGSSGMNVGHRTGLSWGFSF